jgi:hypothetical protein
MTISLQLTADQERLLQGAAQRLGIPVSDLATAAIRDLLLQSSTDYEQVADRVLDKNRELYRRLA